MVIQRWCNSALTVMIAIRAHDSGITKRQQQTAEADIMIIIYLVEYGIYGTTWKSSTKLPLSLKVSVRSSSKEQIKNNTKQKTIQCDTQLQGWCYRRAATGGHHQYVITQRHTVEKRWRGTKMKEPFYHHKTMPQKKQIMKKSDKLMKQVSVDRKGGKDRPTQIFQPELPTPCHATVVAKCFCKHLKPQFVKYPIS